MDANTTSIDLFIVIGLIIIITALHLFITNGAIIRLKMYTFRLQEKIDQLEKKHL
ncbi:hypothetical protein KA478_01320 [Patescibacteria group bacterium]|nr:hypothetical protein [Patescibacteria group bacterium]